VNDNNCDDDRWWFLVEYDTAGPEAAVPTTSDVGIIILIVLTGVGGVFYLRRRRIAEA